MNNFGRNGKFMTDLLNLFDHKKLISFFNKIGVETDIADGFRIFPKTHNSTTIINALEKRLKELNIDILYSTKVTDIIIKDKIIQGVKTDKNNFQSKNIIIATGGLGYSNLGATGDGYNFARKLGHKITELSPAMLPLTTKEKWVNSCKADTIGKVQIKIDLPKAKKLKATGDLIFTSNGLRGPVILDFAREITPLLNKYQEVPILINFVKGMNENDIFEYIKKEIIKKPTANILEILNSILPKSLIKEICLLSNIDFNLKFKQIKGEIKNNFIKNLVSTPLTIIGSDGFKKAMITRGGVSLKEINPKTMQSKIINGLYFCGEIIDLDGPCGGYNLQLAFSSGYLAGHLTINY